MNEDIPDETFTETVASVIGDLFCCRNRVGSAID